MHTQGEGVKQSDGIGDLDAEDDRSKASKIAGHLRAKGDEVLPADGADLDGEGVLVVVDVALGVVGDELLGGLGLDGGDGGEEVDEAGGVRAGAEEEVEAAGGGGDAEGEGGLAVLEEELLEVEEGAAVRDVLAELDDGDPLVGVGLGAGAGIAEAVVDGELDGVGLLEDDGVEDLAAEAELEAEALGVGLGEDELGGGEGDAEAGEGAVEAAEEDLHELGGLRAGAEPGARRLEVGGAVGAVDDGGVARDALGDVDAGADAARAHVGRVGLHRHAADAAQHRAHRLRWHEHAAPSRRRRRPRQHPVPRRIGSNRVDWGISGGGGDGDFWA